MKTQTDLFVSISLKKLLLKNLSDQYIKRIEDMLNNRSRKKLNFLTPNEFLLRNLSNQKVAFVT
jgi:IS30 family transposase